MINNNDTFKYEASYKGPFEIISCLTKGTFTLHYSEIKCCLNIRRIKPYTFDTNIENIIA